MNWFFRNKKKQTPRRSHVAIGQEEYAFRRSRTLTGTTSLKVAPSAEARSQLKTTRLKAHELRQQLSRVLKLLSLIVVCIAVLGFVMMNYVHGIVIRYPQVSTQQPPTSEYQKTIQHYFVDHPLEQFGFSINKTQLGQYVRAQHSEISELDVTKAWYGSNVTFALYFRQPILVWQTGGHRFYVDDKGVAFTYNHFATNLVAVTDQSGIAPDASGAVASKRFVGFLGQLVGAVNATGKGRVVSIVIPPSTREIDLKLEARDYLLKTHINRDPLQQAEDIKNALNYFDSHKIKPQYIDVRVPQKAFYK